MPPKNSNTVFVSAPITGTGAIQRTPHNLGGVPGQVAISLVAGPAGYSQPTVVEGAHDANDVIATVTTNWVYRFIAWS